MSKIVKRVKTGEIFSISLVETPGNGYLWKVQSSDNFFVEGIKTQVDTSNGFQEAAGGPITKIFFIKAKNAGEFEVKFVKVRPWEKNSGPLEVYSEIITVG